MIKFTGEDKDTGRTIIGLGISRENVVKLQAGQPIHVHLEELNLPWKAEIYLFYAETDQRLTDLVKPGIGPETAIHKYREKQ